MDYSSTAYKKIMEAQPRLLPEQVLQLTYEQVANYCNVTIGPNGESPMDFFYVVIRKQVNNMMATPPSINIEPPMEAFYTGQPIMVKITIVGNEVYVPTGVITLSIGGKVIATTPIGEDGKADTTISLDAGQYEISYEYAGDNNFVGSKSNMPIFVQEAQVQE